MLNPSNPNKLQLYIVIKEENIDLCVVTETWLSNNVEDDTWVKCSVLNNDNLKLANVNKISRKGGGITLVYSNNLKSQTPRRCKSDVIRICHMGTRI